MRVILPLAALMAISLAPQSLLPGDDGEKSANNREIPEAVFIPTPHDVVDEMLKLADVRKSEVLYDLGCGDGRIVVAAARDYGCEATGIDIDPLRIRESLENVRKSGLESLVKIENKDMFKVDLRGATVVTLYLSSHLNQRLIPQLEKLRPGARIISHQFAVPGATPDKVVEVKSKADRNKHILYRWTAPIKIRH